VPEECGTGWCRCLCGRSRRRRCRLVVTKCRGKGRTGLRLEVFDADIALNVLLTRSSNGRSYSVAPPLGDGLADTGRGLRKLAQSNDSNLADRALTLAGDGPPVPDDAAGRVAEVAPTSRSGSAQNARAKHTADALQP
jgi:hypothetical protein